MANKSPKRRSVGAGGSSALMKNAGASYIGGAPSYEESVKRVERAELWNLSRDLLMQWSMNRDTLPTEDDCVAIVKAARKIQTEIG